MEPRIQDMLARIKEYYVFVDHSTNLRRDGQFEVNADAIQNIAGLFADDGVYEREGWARSFRGKDAVRGFFDTERSLTGAHEITSAKESAGVDPAVITLFKRQFPAMDVTSCATVKVEGKFTGAKISTDEQKKATHAEGMPLPFKDYWVVSGDKVLYRFSEIVRDNPLERC